MCIRLIFLGIIAVSAGCSTEADPVEQPPYDAALARATLIKVLDSWKKGEARKLARGKPSIRFADDDFVAGLRLSDFELEEPDATIGLHANIPVILSLRDGGGKAIRREARYQVAISPGLAVLRSDQ